MKTMKKYLLTSLFVIICIGIYICFDTYIHSTITYCRSSVAQKIEYYKMHKNVDRISYLPTLHKDTCALYNSFIISHSGGGIDGRFYTNSREAWDYSYSCGNRLFDADCSFTTDSVLVLKHEWDDNLEQTDLPMAKSHIWIDRNGQIRYNLLQDNKMDFHTFMSTHIHKYMTPQSCEDLILYMQKHTDLYVATDMKRNDVVTGYEYLVSLAKKMKAENVLDRIVVSLYEYSDYNQVKNIYPFKHFAMRQYINSPHNYYELAEFCIKHQIRMVNISKCYVNDKGVKEMIKKGFLIFVAVVDDSDEFGKYRKTGVWGCCSNLLHQSDFKYRNE